MPWRSRSTRPRDPHALQAGSRYACEDACKNACREAMIERRRQMGYQSRRLAPPESGNSCRRRGEVHHDSSGQKPGPIEHFRQINARGDGGITKSSRSRIKLGRARPRRCSLTLPFGGTVNYRATLVWAAAAALSLSTACSDSSLEPLRARPGLRPSLDVSSSLFFSDALTGPTSPNLSIPLTKYSYTADGLARTYVDPTINPTGNEIDDRELVRTLSSAYFTTDFTASITVDIRGAKDISYFGFGVGNMDPNYYNEAAHNFLFRIHKWGGYFGIRSEER